MRCIKCIDAYAGFSAEVVGRLRLKADRLAGEKKFVMHESVLESGKQGQKAPMGGSVWNYLNDQNR
jgi:hypothetical protein